MSAGRLLMRSIKSRRKRYATCDDVSNLYTKYAAILKLREGRYCERNPGGVSFTYNNPAARISLQSKLASAMQKTVDLCRRFSAWRRVQDSNPRELSL